MNLNYDNVSTINLNEFEYGNKKLYKKKKKKKI